MTSNNAVHCVCSVIENIFEQQQAVCKKCLTSCYRNLLRPTVYLGDTIPFLLYTEKGELFKASGYVGKDCFSTPFFKIENFDECCATLRLLLPLQHDGHLAEDVCDVHELVKTRICINVDLTCFCAIQCLSPKLVN